jgi:hypothetical protein
MPTYRNDSDSYQTVIDINGDRQSVAPLGTVQTYQVLEAPDWTQTAATPYYNIAQDVHTVTAAGAETKSQAVDPDSHVLEVRTDVALTIHANAAAAEGYPLAADGSVQIRHEGNIATLYLVFSGAGTATIIELKD